MKNTLIILFLTFLVSCQSETKATFIITNETEETLDSVRLKSKAHEHLTEYLKLEPKETKVYLMDMTNLPKVDGEYLLSYKYSQTGKRRTQSFGYFTHGFPLEDTTKIFIMPDTVAFDFIFPDHY